MGGEELGPGRSSERLREAEAGYEDFFTSFLGKKKKAQMKKIDKIISLKESSARLNKEQAEMVSREGEIRRQIQHFDEIRELYLAAMSRQENEQSNWMTPEAKLRGLLGLYMTRGKVPADMHHAGELNKSFAEVFQAESLEEAVHCGTRFADNKLLNNSLSIAVAESEAARKFEKGARKPAESKHDSAEAQPNPNAGYDGEYSNADKKRAAPRGRAAEPSRQVAQAPQKAAKPNTIKGKFLQSDEDEEDEEPPARAPAPVPAAVHSAKGAAVPSNLILLPETQEKEAENWISVGDFEPRPKRERRGGRGSGPRRDAPQTHVGEQNRQSGEPLNNGEAAVTAPAEEKATERKAAREQNRQRDNFPEQNRQRDNFPEQDHQGDNFPQQNRQRENFHEQNRQRDNFPEQNRQRDNLHDRNFPRNPFPKQNRRLDNVPEQNRQRDNVPEQNRQRDNFPEQNLPRDNFPEQNRQRDNVGEQNRQRENPQRKGPPRDNAPEQNRQRENAPRQGPPRDNFPRQERRQKSYEDEYVKKA